MKSEPQTIPCDHCEGHGVLPTGAAIRQARIDRGLTQREVAIAANLSHQYISNLELGHRGRVVSWTRFAQIMDAMDREVKRKHGVDTLAEALTIVGGKP